MPKNAYFPKILILLCLAALLAPGAALAQTSTPTPSAPQSGIHITDVMDPTEVVGPEGIPGLSVEVRFMLLDSSKNILLNPSPGEEGSTIDIPEGAFPAGVQIIAQPAWTIIVLVDTSRTMSTIQGAATLKKIRESINSSLTPGGQQNMKIQVVKFDQQPTNIDPPGFTQNAEAYAKAINDLRGTPTGNSCVNNAAMNSINQLAPLPGRKAIILFTASQDNCGATTAAQVVQAAEQQHVQIYAVGVQGYVTQQDVDSISVGTGGLGIISPESTLGFAVSNLSGILANQYAAKATLCPSQAGPATGSLDLVLSDGSKMTSGFFSFNSPKPFVCPPNIQILGVVRPKTYGIDFNLGMTSTDLIDRLEVTIDNKLTGQNTITQVLTKTQFGDENQFQVRLEEGVAYTLTLTALSSTGAPLAQDGQEFTYVPEQVQINVNVAAVPTLNASEWTIEIEPDRPEGVVKFEVFLADKDEPTGPVTDTQTIPVGEKLTFPATDKLPAGEYTLVVQALDDADRIVAQGASLVTWQPFTWFDRLKDFVNNPIGIALMAVLCCGALFGLVGVVWVVIPKPNAQLKQVDLMVPEKRQQRAAPVDSGFFDAPAPQAPPPTRQEPPPQRAAPAPPPVAAPPPSDMPRAFLGGYSPPGVMPQIQITRVPLTIGRRVGNDVVLSVDNSMGVSGQHAKITFSNGRFFVIDEGSTYGSTLNGQTIPKGMPMPLEDGAVLGFGPKVKLQFRLDRS